MSRALLHTNAKYTAMTIFRMGYVLHRHVWGISFSVYIINLWSCITSIKRQTFIYIFFSGGVESDVETHGGNADGASCVFPFMAGRKYVYSTFRIL